jgi:5-methyltetrahydrofolate--homocysteine methyltransferase
MEIVKQIAQSLIDGDDERVPELARRALAEGTGAHEILDGGLIAGMNVVGERFRTHEIFLPDVLLAAKAMHAGLEVIKPHLEGGAMATAGRVVIGTVQGDLHDIGKNLVGILLKGAGFDVIDLGKDVPPRRFVDAARDAGAGVIGMSALLTTTMPVMKQVVDLLASEGLAGRVHTIVGGAPVSAEFAREIGADGYAYDAANAVERVRALMS